MATRVISELNLFNDQSKKINKASKYIHEQTEKHHEGKYKMKQDKNVNKFAIEEEEILKTQFKPKKKKEVMIKMTAIQNLICNIVI